MAREPRRLVDPAIAPLIEAGEGEAEGFDVAEADLIRHAEHGDEQGTDPIWRDAAGFRAEEIPDSTTTATARPTTRTRKPDRASRRHEAGERGRRLRRATCEWQFQYDRSHPHRSACSESGRRDR